MRFLLAKVVALGKGSSVSTCHFKLLPRLVQSNLGYLDGVGCLFFVLSMAECGVFRRTKSNFWKKILQKCILQAKNAYVIIL